MRWISWLIASLALAFGAAMLHFEEQNTFAKRVDGLFQDWLIAVNNLPRHEPIPVTLVAMEDAANWTPLEYSLFLKALPAKNPPIVIIESLPPAGNTAFDRAFNDLAIKQPRLVLPVHLSTESKDDEEANWWLKGWKAEPQDPAQPAFTHVADGPSEVLRGAVETGIANLPETADPALLYFKIGKKNIPSLALRGVLLAWKLSDDKVRFGHNLFLGNRRLKSTEQGALPVNTAFLSEVRRVTSSDLLLTLAPETADASVPSTNKEPLRGVVVLGDLAEGARHLRMNNGPQLTPAEWIAATVATICNTPILTPVAEPTRFVILALSGLATLLFSRPWGLGKWFALLALLGIYLYSSLVMAGQFAVTLPLALPAGILLVGAILHGLAAFFPTKKT